MRENGENLIIQVARMEDIELVDDEIATEDDLDAGFLSPPIGTEPDVQPLNLNSETKAHQANEPPQLSSASQPATNPSTTETLQNEKLPTFRSADAVNASSCSSTNQTFDQGQDKSRRKLQDPKDNAESPNVSQI